MFGLGMPEFIIFFIVILIIFIFGVKPFKRKSQSKHQRNVKGLSSERKKISEEHDIFLSYATPDRPTAKAISESLSALGWSVWWDRSIPPGKSFDRVIEAAIDSAHCIVVLWSEASVNSDWVKTEASEGLKRQILVPALIEEVKIPLEFRRIQAADLIGWKSSRSHSGFQNMVSAIQSTLDR